MKAPPSCPSPPPAHHARTRVCDGDGLQVCEPLLAAHAPKGQQHAAQPRDRGIPPRLHQLLERLRAREGGGQLRFGGLGCAAPAPAAALQAACLPSCPLGRPPLITGRQLRATRSPWVWRSCASAWATRLHPCVPSNPWVRRSCASAWATRLHQCVPSNPWVKRSCASVWAHQCAAPTPPPTFPLTSSAPLSGSPLPPAAPGAAAAAAGPAADG